MPRKIIALLVSLAALWAIKETVFIFITAEPEIAAKRDQLKLASLSLTVPLIIVSVWLWRPKPKGERNEP